MGLNKHVILNDSISWVGRSSPLIIVNFAECFPGILSRAGESRGERLESSVDPPCNCLLYEQRGFSEMMLTLPNSSLKMECTIVVSKKQLFTTSKNLTVKPITIPGSRQLSGHRAFTKGSLTSMRFSIQAPTH